jgi:hypothetical protein
MRRPPAAQLGAAFSRIRASSSAISGVRALPKSAASNTGRISISLGPRLGKGAIDNGAACSVESNPLALDRRVQALARQKDAGVGQLLVVFAHGLEKFGRGHDPGPRFRR